MPEEPTAEPAPASLRTALLLLGAETAALGLLTLYLLYETIFVARPAVIAAYGVILFAALFAGLLGWFTWSLLRRRAWALGPAVVLQLLMVPIGVTMLTGGLAVVGLPTVLIGLLGAGTLLAPTTRGALGRN